MIIIQTVPNSKLAFMQIVLLSFFNYDQYLLLQDLDPEFINFIPELTLWESFLYVNGSNHKNPGWHSHTQGQLKAWIYFSVVAVNMRILNLTVEDFSSDFAQWLVDGTIVTQVPHFCMAETIFTSVVMHMCPETVKQSQRQRNSLRQKWIQV